MTLIFDNGGGSGGGTATVNKWTSGVVSYYSNATLEPDTDNDTYKDYTVDLSTLLPDDGAQYEVLFLIAATSGNVVVNSDVVNALGGYVGWNSEQRQQLLAPVGNSRSITLRVYATTSGFYLNSSAYRKIGE